MAWQNRLQHLGLTFYPRRSTLSDANTNRTHQFFEDAYYALHDRYKHLFLPDSRRNKDRIHIMDSSTFELFSDVMVGAGSFDRNGKRKGGVKAHMLIDARHQLPEVCYLSEAKENDRLLMDKISLLPGSILVFDKGYIKYSQWQTWTERNITWVTRMMNNAYYEVVQNMPVDEAQKKRGVISDEHIWLGRGTNASTEIIPARRIVFHDKKKNRNFVFLTNNEKFKPSTIAGFYKIRWTIETKFKAIKQNFQLKYFLGDTPNAIKIQLWGALIANLLVEIIAIMAKKKRWSFANLCGLLRMHLGTYVNLTTFLNSPEKSLQQLINSNNSQLQFSFNST
jgi:hypothetical protein